MQHTLHPSLATAAGILPLISAAENAFSAPAAARPRLGVCTYSYGIHWRVAREAKLKIPFKDPVEFLGYCHELGAGGVQIGLGPAGALQAAELRRKAETWQMYFEGQVTLPKAESDVDRFAADIRAAREAGATVVRTAMLSSRRYETFESLEAFHRFAEQSWHSLTLAEPIVRQHRVRLAIENHKDWRVPDLLDLLQRISSEYVGVCVDTGNSIALLEDPMMVVEALAPFAFTTHLKDMAVQSDPDGFLLAEVPLGAGFLDVKRMVTLLLKANPRIQFNLEMITRDPLRIPCLTEKYWATMKSVPARELSAALKMVRQHAATRPLPRITGLAAERQLEREDEHVRASFAYSRRSLEL